MSRDYLLFVLSWKIRKGLLVLVELNLKEEYSNRARIKRGQREQDSAVWLGYRYRWGVVRRVRDRSKRAGRDGGLEIAKQLEQCEIYNINMQPASCHLPK